MKKFFVLTVIFTLILAACSQSQSGENSTQGNKLPTLTIINESSYILTNVKFMGLDFSTSGTKDIPVSSQATRQISSDLINISGNITFSFKDTPGVTCRTSDRIIVDDNGLIYRFLDITVVEELTNSSNKKPLSQITFSRISIEKEGRSVVKNDIVPLGETVENYISQYEFSIKNTGAGKLKLIGNEPVKIIGLNEAFSIIQPTSSEINPNGTLIFKVNFNPKLIQSYSTQITIYSDDKDGDFTFTITAVGTVSKPIAKIIYETNDITQNGTIDIGREYITKYRNISVIIKNSGTEVLTIESENITITGTDIDAFTILTNPGKNISIGSQTSFNIEFKPTKQTEYNVILTIPTNDDSRNPIEVYIKGIGEKGNAVLQLSQGTTNITNNSLTPINFNNGTSYIEIGTNKALEFNIKNNGNINLELTGDPVVVSSNTVFTVSTQPSIKILIPGSTTSFVIIYTPTTEENDTGSITIANNSEAEIFTFSVIGTGYIKKSQIIIQQGTATIALHSEYDFGTIDVGKIKDIVFAVKNMGDANLTFDNANNNRINLEDNESGFFTVTQQPSATAVVTPGNTTIFTIRFNPTLTGSNVTANVRIKTNSRENDNFSFIVKGKSGSYKIGDIGPGGGLIFYAENGQYKECSGELGKYSWNNAITAAQNYRSGGFTNWRLPNKDEVDLLYRNLHRNDIGEFTSSASNVESAYWSSSEYNSNYAWFQLFSNGNQHYSYTYYPAISSGVSIPSALARASVPIVSLPTSITVNKTYPLRVRAVRSFSF